MNCQNCGNRNPSHAKTCMHCGARLENAPKDGFFDIDSDDPDNIYNKKSFQLGLVAVVVLFIGGIFYIVGFDTYDVKCTRSSSKAAAYEADPKWERDRATERRRLQKEARRKGRSTVRYNTSSLRCFKMKTGHVDGALEK